MVAHSTRKCSLCSPNMHTISLNAHRSSTYVICAFIECGCAKRFSDKNLLVRALRSQRAFAYKVVRLSGRQIALYTYEYMSFSECGRARKGRIPRGFYYTQIVRVVIGLIGSMARDVGVLFK